VSDVADVSLKGGARWFVLKDLQAVCITKRKKAESEAQRGKNLLKRGGFLLTLQEKLKNSPAAPQAPAGAGCAIGAARLRR